MYAAEQVLVSGSGQSLRTLMETFPKGEDHPLYAELKNGFPKAYSLSLELPSKAFSFPCRYTTDDIFTFRLCLLGEAAACYPYFISAIRLMGKRGMGNPMQPFAFIDAHELSPQGQTQLLAKGEMDRNVSLRFPYEVEPLPNPHESCSISAFQVDFHTPTCLVKPAQKKCTDLSYQDKLNGFPSFYQLVRTALHRYEKMQLLYAEGPPDWEVENKEAFLVEAGKAQLQDCCLQNVSIPSPLRKENVPGIRLSGYVGRLLFSGNLKAYLPLLHYLQPLGLGHGCVYGLGRYEVTEVFSPVGAGKEKGGEKEERVQKSKNTRLAITKEL